MEPGPSVSTESPPSASFIKPELIKEEFLLMSPYQKAHLFMQPVTGTELVYTTHQQRVGLSTSKATLHLALHEVCQGETLERVEAQGGRAGHQLLKGTEVMADSIHSCVSHSSVCVWILMWTDVYTLMKF